MSMMDLSELGGAEPSKCVFVGNIPFDATESQLREVFSQAGSVVNIRIVHDRETSKPKGYGFVEFRDTASAASAVRNISNVDFHGRFLRVDFTDSETMQGSRNRTSDRIEREREREREQRETILPSMKPSLGKLGAAAQPQPSGPPQHSLDAISTVISQLNKHQLLEILSEMRKFIVQNPDAARQLLIESPQIAQALLQIQIVFGLVRPQDIQSLQQRPAAPPPMHAPGPTPIPGPTAGLAPGPVPNMPPQHIPSHHPPHMPGPQPPHMPQYGAPPHHPHAPPPHHGFPPPQHGIPPGPPSTSAPMMRPTYAPPTSAPTSLPTPPVPTPAPAPAPTPVPAPAPAAATQPSTPSVAQQQEALLAQQLSALPPQEQQLLRELLKLSPEQIRQLPAAAQQQVLTLQQQLAAFANRAGAR